MRLPLWFSRFQAIGGASLPSQRRPVLLFISLLQSWQGPAGPPGSLSEQGVFLGPGVPGPAVSCLCLPVSRCVLRLSGPARAIIWGHGEDSSLPSSFRTLVS